MLQSTVLSLGGELSVCLHRAEDHGAIMSLFEDRTNQQLAELLSAPSLRKELAGAQEEHKHRAVCEVCPDVCCPVPSGRSSVG